MPFPSNLGNIAKHFPEYIREIETIQPHIRPPWWSLKATIRIDENKEKAEDHHSQTTAHLTNPITEGPNPTTEIAHIYTDGSGINQGIGAAMYCHTTQHISLRHLGKETESMVYAGELEAIHMAITHAKELATEITGCRIFTDSQPAIKSIAKPRRQSGQSIIKRILDEIEELQRTKSAYTLSFEWVPGHVGIEGNEKADEAAKKAATQTDPSESGPWQMTLKSARANAIHQAIKKECNKEWANGRKTATKLRQVTKTTNVKPSAHIYETLGNKRKNIATIARLRTGHCSLNHYLHRFNIIEDPTCACGDAQETVTHFLLVCSLHEREQDKLRRKVGIGGMRVERLLGDPRRIKHTIEFIERVGRFDF